MASDCNWRLEAISKAAQNRKKISFVLKEGENTVGKTKGIQIKIPSVLCSREHCTIFLDDGKVTLKDTSRNGTYITYANETKHYTDTSTEKPLEQNDIISFGFNTAAVYDVNDKNAFIYRLVKEQIETIDLGDSDDDDDDDAPPPTTKDKFIQISNKVIDIDSDSDSNYSGDECLKNIEEMEEASTSSSSSMIEDDLSNSEDYSESDESIGSEEESFVVTKTILKCGTPTETIALDEDDDDVPEIVEDKSTQSEQSKNKVANGQVNEAAPSDKDEKSKEEDIKTIENDDEPMTEDVTSTDDVEKSAEKSLAESDTSADQGTKPEEKSDEGEKPDEKSEDDEKQDKKSEDDEKQDKTSEEDEKQDKTSEEDEKPDKKSEEDVKPARKSSLKSNNHVEASTSRQAERTVRIEKLEKLRRSLAENTQKKTAYTKPQSLRKRRRTVTEDEYNQHREVKKLATEEYRQLRREKLAKIAEEQNKQKPPVPNINRVPFVPKVKIPNVTRSDILCTDMLAFNPTNP